MTSVSASQLTLNFEPSLAERFPSLRAYVNHRTHVLPKSAKVIAAGMDMSPSLLSRKLQAGTDPDDKDTQRFNCDDLEKWLSETNDAPAVIEYLAAKYLGGGDAARRTRAISTAERLLSELSRVLPELKGEA